MDPMWPVGGCAAHSPQRERLYTARSAPVMIITRSARGSVCRVRLSALARVLFLSRYLRLFFIYLCGCFFLAFSQSERLELSRAQENTPKRQRRTWAKTRRLPDGSPLRMSPASASTMYMGTERVWSVRGLTIGSRLPHIWPSMTSDDL